jgi:DeoR family fructose operon transcriptional repressor
MYSIERQSEILKIVEETGRVEVNDLAALFQASRETIRRDLRDMEEKRLLRRTHGGAVLENALSAATEFPVGIREIQRFKEKDAICQKAASFIQDGDIVFIDNSSTCLSLLRHITPGLHLTVITNSIKLLLGAPESSPSNLMLISLGGLFHSANLSTYGTIAQNNAANFYPTRCFISCAGILPPDRLFDSSLLEVDTKRMMIDRAGQVFLLADHTKFDRTGPVYLADFSAIHHLIVDKQTTPSQVAPFEKSGTQISWSD